MAISLINDVRAVRNSEEPKDYGDREQRVPERERVPNWAIFGT